MTHAEHQLAAQLYQPSSASMAKNLPDIGEALAAALVELSRHTTPERCEEMGRRLQAASHAVGRLRAALIAEGGQ